VRARGALSSLAHSSQRATNVLSNSLSRSLSLSLLEPLVLALAQVEEDQSELTFSS